MSEDDRATLGIVLMRGRDGRRSIGIDVHMDVHRTTAHLAILDIVLLFFGAVDLQFDALAAVRTVDID